VTLSKRILEGRPRRCGRDGMSRNAQDRPTEAKGKTRHVGSGKAAGRIADLQGRYAPHEGDAYDPLSHRRITIRGLGGAEGRAGMSDAPVGFSSRSVARLNRDTRGMIGATPVALMRAVVLRHHRARLITRRRPLVRRVRDKALPGRHRRRDKCARRAGPSAAAVRDNGASKHTDGLTGQARNRAKIAAAQILTR